MRVIHVPSGLRVGAALFLAAVPLAAIQYVLAVHAPWWRLPYRAITLWGAVAAFLFVPWAIALFRGKSWAWYPVAFAGVGWTAYTAFGSLYLRNPAWGFMAVFLGVFLGSLLAWTRFQLKRSFMDPRMLWYQGLPEPLPGLSCNLEKEGFTNDFRVSRIDREGAFIFSPAKGENGLARIPEGETEVVPLVFRFRNREVRCEGRLASLLHDGVGGGFRFESLSSDGRKELGDFIEFLRGEGYVD